MARNSRKKALYEVIRHGKGKPSYHKTLGNLYNRDKPSQDSRKDEKKPEIQKQLPERAPDWPIKPKLCQINRGRIELTLPYQLVIAGLLAIILLVLVAFRLGENLGEKQSAGLSAARLDTSVEPEKIEPAEPLETKPAVPAGVVNSSGDNRIVIQTYQLKSHLAPVQKYFAGFGIATEIIRKGDWYYLVTKNKYEKPNRPGTDGYKARERIVKLGASYVAPEGYEPFGPKPFHDAFGMKFED